MGFQQAV